MGRGLSQLQRWILVKALEKLEENEQNGIPLSHACLTYAEIKIGFFDMRPIRNEMNGQRFKKKTLSNYNAVSVTISRATHLLAGHRLVTVARRGLQLTDMPMRAEIRLTKKGADVAAKLDDRFE
jgi:hypothetical protein